LLLALPTAAALTSACLQDRSFAVPHKQLPVLDMAMSEFRECVLAHSDVRTRVGNVLLEAIARSRAGEAIDKSLMRGTLNMLVVLGIGTMDEYESTFESRFLAETDEFFREESTSFLATNTCPEYLRKAESRIVEERTRVQEYLTDGTGQRLRSVVERRLIADHTGTLVDMDTGAIAMMESSKFEELKTMYRLFSMVRTTAKYTIPLRVAGRETGGSVERELTPMGMLRERFQRHIEGKGSALVSDSEESKDPVRFVSLLLEMRKQFSDIVTLCFFNDREYARSMKEAFEFFVNADGRCAHFLTLFLDAEFRVGFRTKAPVEIEEALSSVITLFRFIKDKDVFESYYKQHLQKRLLAGRSVSDDAERSMISKLKAECGPQFTSKMEGMFNDLAMSKHQMVSYRRDTVSHHHCSACACAHGFAIAGILPISGCGRHRPHHGPLAVHRGSTLSPPSVRPTSRRRVPRLVPGQAHRPPAGVGHLAGFGRSGHPLHLAQVRTRRVHVPNVHPRTLQRRLAQCHV
jgi:cullin 3